ncbi:desulfoferrodoxin family protein [Anaerovoracaceae bacterium SGI.174]
MDKEVKYYVCKHCGNIIEKHVPVHTLDGNLVHVVGEIKHPMLEEHFIEWITLNTNQGVYRKQLNPGQEPVADFCLCDERSVFRS